VSIPQQDPKLLLHVNKTTPKKDPHSENKTYLYKDLRKLRDAKTAGNFSLMALKETVADTS